MLNYHSDLDLEVADLLVCSGFLMPHELDKALANKRECGGRLKDYLVDARLIEDNIFVAASAVIEQIRQSRLPRASARTALYMVGNCRMSVDEALTKMGHLTTTTNPWQNQLNILAESKKWG
jgi:hypothetical protein